MSVRTSSTPIRSSSTPTFTTPASARVHPTTSSPATATSAPTTTGSAAIGTTTANTPSYVLPGGAATSPGAASTFRSTLKEPGRAGAHGKHSEALSTGAIAAAAVAAVLLLACLGWALARRRAFEPHWLLSLRHAIAEAGFRASATWAEFSDWVRLGH
jgi:hypothetical protein